MKNISKSAPWGAWRSFALKAPKSRIYTGPLPKLSARLARDIGLTENDQMRANFQWPSDGPDRPLL